MKWYLNMKTRGKILASLGLLLLMNLMVIGFAYGSMAAMRSAQDSLFNRDFLGSVNLAELRAKEYYVRALMLELLLTKDKTAQQKLETDIGTVAKNIDITIQTVSEEFKGDPVTIAKIGELNALRDVNTKIRDSQIVLVNDGKIEEATASTLGPLKTKYDEIRAIALALGTNSKSAAVLEVAKSGRTTRLASLVFLIIGALSSLLCVLLTLAMNTAIAKPLSRLTGIAETLASGDLSLNIGSSLRKDEIGALLRAFNRMVAGLRGFAAEIIDGVGVLSASSSEILSSTSQVAAGATQTAAAVSETTTAVEEVKQGARMTNEKARGVSELSQNAIRAAKEGLTAVELSTERMAAIRLQVEAIAETVIRLSEQGLAIGEIIETVGNFAEQTNLLAVNAAIEAAKAGEQGKGFAVVAQEVRSLAEQSKSATAQVRSILTDVKKATDAAVMATEQGGKAVESGTLQAGKAGEAIKLMGETIEAAAQSAIQIAASSQEQMVGMDQVAIAMESIQEASEQNVSGMRQVETTVQALHAFGRRLTELAARYKV